jgi:hypothetical protein
MSDLCVLYIVQMSEERGLVEAIGEPIYTTDTREYYEGFTITGSSKKKFEYRVHDIVSTRKT